MDIIEGVISGSRLALSRAITAVENEYEEAVEIMRGLYPHTGRAFVIGITGPPGAGKSTLTDKLIKEYRQKGKTVGVIAVDPTSPFTGGAILGDRIRMNDLTLDEGVFIRSMGTRGNLGGLSRKTAEVVKIFDAAGKDVIFIETVGVGQSEVDIVKAADTTVVVLVPGLGDDIQAIKAGILEIGDVFVINKADREGADRLAAELGMMLDLSQGNSKWRPPIMRVIANQGQGIIELTQSLEEHITYLSQTGELAERRKNRTKSELILMLTEAISGYITNKLQQSGKLEQLIEDVQERRTDPYQVITEILNSCLVTK